MDSGRRRRWATMSWFTKTKPARPKLPASISSANNGCLEKGHETLQTLAHQWHTWRHCWTSQQWHPYWHIRDCYYSLADFVAPADSGREDYLGAFAVTGGMGSAELVKRFEADNDDYSAIMSKVLADRLAEAFAECLHERARIDWQFGRDENLTIEDMIAEKYRGIRPAPGYPSLPDHTEKHILFDLMQVERQIGMSLTESYMMVPPASVCGFIFSHPASHYFAINRITRDQVEDYARRKGMKLKEAEKWLAPVLGYEIE